VGAGVCLVAMAFGMLLLIWSTLGVLWGILTWIFGFGRNGGANLVRDGPIGKRALDDGASSATDGGNGLHSLVSVFLVWFGEHELALALSLICQLFEHR
jgi:hypothetical protein